jgi:hypothetical protein
LLRTGSLTQLSPTGSSSIIYSVLLFSLEFLFRMRVLDFHLCYNCRATFFYLIWCNACAALFAIETKIKIPKALCDSLLVVRAEEEIQRILLCFCSPVESKRVQVRSTSCRCNRPPTACLRIGGGGEGIVERVVRRTHRRNGGSCSCSCSSKIVEVRCAGRVAC